MKTRRVALLTGILLLSAEGTALAHDSGRYVSYPAGVSGVVTVWGGSHQSSGWTGSISVGTPVVLAAPLAPVPAIVPVYRHGPRCLHKHQHPAYRGHPVTYRHGYANGRKNGHRGDPWYGYRD